MHVKVFSIQMFQYFSQIALRINASTFHYSCNSMDISMYNCYCVINCNNTDVFTHPWLQQYNYIGRYVAATTVHLPSLLPILSGHSSNTLPFPPYSLCHQTQYPLLPTYTAVCIAHKYIAGYVRICQDFVMTS